MSGADDKKGKEGRTPPETRLYSTPGHDPNQTLNTGPAAAFSDPNLAPLAERFELLQELGRGGMGVVYKARDRETGGVVALKVLNPAIAGDPALLGRFKNELLLAHKITHKNVCRTHDLHRFGPTSVITMEFVEGETLRNLLRRRQGISLRYGLKLARQICSGLKEAHAQGVVHRDLKPENLMVDRDGNLKIMDFGIARSLEAGATLTEGITGTPAYMAPEQAEGKKIDQRTDIYALGLVLYEIFTGERAFRGDTPVAIVHKQIHETPAAPTEATPIFPVQLEHTILKCLEKNPKNRFQSMEELDEALTHPEKLLVEVSGQTEPETEPVPPPHLMVWSRRDWVLLAVGILSLLFFTGRIVVGLGFTGFRERVFPASRMKLEVDAITARREVERLANQLGRSLQPNASSHLEIETEEYRSALLGELFRRGKGASPPDAFQEVSRRELPLRWRITFSRMSSPRAAMLEEEPTEYAQVDRKGRVVLFAVPYRAAFVTPSYQPPAAEERRALARQAAEAACGPVPSEVRLIETVGGEGRASYTVAWKPIRPPDSLPWAEVSLLAEKVVQIDCSTGARARLPPVQEVVKEVEYLFRMSLLVMFVALMSTFFMGGGHQATSTLWKKLPLALFLGFTSMWVFSPAFLNSAPSYPLLLGGGVAAASLFLVWLVAAEHLLLRRNPGIAASYLLLLRGRVLQPTVGMAVIRGALAGLILAALNTALVYLSLAVLSSNVHDIVPALFGVLVDPSPLGHAMGSLSPALFVVCAAVLCGIIVGFLVMGAGFAVSYKEILKSRNKKMDRLGVLIVLGLLYMVAVVGLELPVGKFMGVLGPFFTPVLPGLLIVWLAYRYDVLTVVMAVATATLWELNYPLLDILSEVGNASHWAVFLGWFAVVAAGAPVAFRKQFDKWRQRVAEDFR